MVIKLLQANMSTALMHVIAILEPRRMDECVDVRQKDLDGGRRQ